MSNRYFVIMAGGRGERFWPRSRLHRPKHLLAIVGEKPMLAQAVDRLDGLAPPENIFIVTNRDQREAILETVPAIPPENVVGEPVGRDTAAAVGLATLLIKARDPNGAFAILPADHVIDNVAGFQQVMKAAFSAAEKADYLVTIGLKPTEPATGYGYIQRGETVAEAEGQPVFQVERFVEKPKLETAREYLASGDYYWNAGMFIWRVPVIEKAFFDHAPALRDSLASIENAMQSGASLESALGDFYPGIPKTSIDYAVMEKAPNVVTIESAFDWDDVGSWPAVARHYPRDSAGNTVLGEVLAESATNNIIVSNDGHLIAAVGVDDLVIIHTPDATLVCRKDQAQDVKKVVKRLSDDPAKGKWA